MKKLMPFILGLVLAALGGGGGFYAASQGLVAGPTAGGVKLSGSGGAEEAPTFVTVDPLIVSLGGELSGRHLRFAAKLEVPAAHADDVAHVMPRVVDVLNGYLRAVDRQDLETPGGLLMLREQMLQRVRIAAGPGHVDDLLVMEFVVN